MQRKCVTLRMSLMKANARANPCGPSCEYHTRAHDISMSCITSVRPLAGSSMTGCWSKGMRTPSESTETVNCRVTNFMNIFLFSLVAKWKKAGYEKLCCLRCIQTRVRCILELPRLYQPLTAVSSLQDMNYQGSTCICRVPKAQLRAGTVVECVHCGTYMLATLSISCADLLAPQAAAAVVPTHDSSSPCKVAVLAQPHGHHHISWLSCRCFLSTHLVYSGLKLHELACRCSLLPLYFVSLLGPIQVVSGRNEQITIQT